MLTIHLIAAARPNFMKVAPLYHALADTDWAEPVIVHTGQHYDFNMSDAFFRDLRLPEPGYHLGVGSGTHAEQTGGVMIAYEKVCIDNRPDCVVVAGDVNSTVACALAATKLHIPCVHLEAGLRSGDRTMPEEINRLATDAICDLLWTPSLDGNEHLQANGVNAERVEFVGNIMIDSFEMMREQIDADTTRQDLGLSERRYALVTLHRPSNVDGADTLSDIVTTLVNVSENLPLVMVAHPRTLASLERHGMRAQLEAAKQLQLLEPLPYIRFMNVVKDARMVITDSGGLQEETTYLGIPCLTMRPNTERPTTIVDGTNRLVTPATLGADVDDVLNAPVIERRQPPQYWDGQTAGRARDSLKRFLNVR
ncbi:MAG: UDP-N-acetylglucosamine 2-epimerase (non-hydrolyzing) [Pseudomonadota bacterium]